MSEIGIRIALGAHASDIVPLVLRRSASLVLVGITVGAAAAVAANRLLAALLTEVGAVDRPVLLGACVLILLAAFVACLLPAVRAARLDPIDALNSK
jgi:ABC-type antimicrobial peptide transport system permease subunit